MMRTAVTAVVLALALSACSHSYSGEMHSALRRTYGRDFPNYTFRGTPVGNFGAGTMYTLDVTEPRKSAGPVDEQWLVGHPNTYFEDNIPAVEREQLLRQIIEVGAAGDQALNEAISTKLGLSAAVPPIQQLASGEVGMDLEKGVKVVLRASGAKNRRVNWTMLQKAATDGKLRKEIRPYLTQRNFVIAADDIELDGYTATITIDQKANAKLAAKLDGLKGTPLGDGKLQVTPSSGVNGVYEVRASSPVVVAVLYRRPPGVVGQGIENVDQWEVVGVKSNLLLPLEDLLREKGRAPR